MYLVITDPYVPPHSTVTASVGESVALDDRDASVTVGRLPNTPDRTQDFTIPNVTLQDAGLYNFVHDTRKDGINKGYYMSYARLIVRSKHALW